MGFPGFNYSRLYGEPYGEEEDPTSFMGRYRSLYSALPDTTLEAAVNPDDPELASLQRLYAESSGADELVGDYISRRPERENYDPSIGRRLLATLLGTLGGGYNTAKSFVEQPYANDYAEWKDEGNYIDDRARLLEAEKKRKIQGVEFGLRQKSAVNRQNLLNEARRRSEAANLAKQQELEQERKRVAERQTTQDKRDQEWREFQKSNTIADNRRADEAAKDRKTRQAEFDAIRAEQRAQREELARLTMPGRINEYLVNTASQAGIPNKNPDTEEKMTSAELAEQLARKEAYEAGYKGIVSLDGGLYLVNEEYPHDGVKKQLKKFLQARIQKYLRGGK